MFYAGLAPLLPFFFQFTLWRATPPEFFIETRLIFWGLTLFAAAKHSTWSKSTKQSRSEQVGVLFFFFFLNSGFSVWVTGRPSPPVVVSLLVFLCVEALRVCLSHPPPVRHVLCIAAIGSLCVCVVCSSCHNLASMQGITFFLIWLTQMSVTGEFERSSTRLKFAITLQRTTESSRGRLVLQFYTHRLKTCFYFLELGSTGEKNLFKKWFLVCLTFHFSLVMPFCECAPYKNNVFTSCFPT